MYVGASIITLARTLHTLAYILGDLLRLHDRPHALQLAYIYIHNLQTYLLSYIYTEQDEGVGPTCTNSSTFACMLNIKGKKMKGKAVHAHNHRTQCICHPVQNAWVGPLAQPLA